MHLWDQHRFGVLGLDAAPDPAYGADLDPDADLDLA